MLDFYKKRSLTLNIAYTSYFNIQYSRRLPENREEDDLADAPSPAILSSYFT